MQRVSTGSIYNVIPINVGDKIDTRKATDITRSLFKTEQFDNIEIGKEGNTLIINVVERPSIALIEITGNKALKTEQLIESLDGVGIKEGEVYKRSTLDKVKSELIRSYASNGRYGAGVSINEVSLPRNRIEIGIEVDEGSSAKIKKINVIGNEIFTNEELIDNFELSEGSFFSFLNNNNSYSREKLKGDIETLESFYRDRGIKFSIESSQLAFQDLKDIFINFNVYEGEKYKISDVQVIGDTPFEESAYIFITSPLIGQTYSQIQITQIEEFFLKHLVIEALHLQKYLEVQRLMMSLKKSKLFLISILVKELIQGKFCLLVIKLHKIMCSEKEMRQFEGSWTSDQNIEFELRLERLGYFKEVEVETVPVPATDDQIDIIYTVEEEVTGSVGGNIGYSDFGLQLGSIARTKFLRVWEYSGYWNI